MPVQNFGNTSEYLNYPTTPPTLDLNFAATKTLDPRITFSRASSATYVDANGVIQTAAANVPRFDHDPVTGESLGLLVEEGRTNRATYSDRLYLFNDGGATAVKIPNAALAPDATWTATNFIPLTGVQHNRISITAATITVSVYAKSNGLPVVRIGAAGSGGNQQFNLSSGQLGAASNITSASITAVGNGWYRCVATWVQSADNTLFVDHTGSTIDGVSGILLWGLQVETGSFPTSYIPTPATFTSRASSATYYDATGTIQTAGNGVARSNAFFPDSNGVMRPAGLLLEGASTNLVTYSEQFDNAAWNKANSSVTANTTTAPDGTSTADKLVENTANSAHAVWTGLLMSNGTTYTYSVFAKAAGRTWMYLASNQSWGNAYFNLSNGTIGTVTAGAIASIAALGNGWYRCSVSVSATSTGQVAIYAASGDGVPIYTGDGTSGIFIWGAQLEASPYPTSYIQSVASTVTRNADTSTSATVTRSADVAQMTGSNFSSWYRKDEGTLFSNISTAYQNGKGLFSIHTGTSTIVSNSIHLTQTSLNRINYEVYNETTQSTLLSTGILTSNELFNKLAASYKVNDFAVSYNGASVQTDNTGSLPVGMTSLTLGGRTENSSTIGKTTISRLTYWPIRLSNDQLRLLTQ